MVLIHFFHQERSLADKNSRSNDHLVEVPNKHTLETIAPSMVAISKLCWHLVALWSYTL